MALTQRLALPSGAVRALGVGLLLIAAALLGHDINRSLWYDEAATYQFATYSWAHLWRAVHLADAFYFAYYAFLHVWIGVFGHSEASLRAPSLLFALAALPVTFGLVRRLASFETATLTVVLLALNAFFFEYATEARPYSMLLFAAALLSLLIVRASEPDAPASRWYAYAATAAIAMNVQFFAIFTVAAHGAYFLVMRDRRNFLKLAAAGAVAFVAVLPMLWLALHDTASQNSFLGRFSLKQIPTVLGTFAGSKLLWRINLLFACLGVALGLRRKRGRAVAFLVCGAVVPLLLMLILSMRRPLFAPRYLIELLPFYTALTALGVTALGRARYIAAIAYVALTGYVFAHLERRVPEDWPAVARRVAGTRIPVVFYPKIGIHSLAYYLPEVRRRTLYPADQRLENTTDFARLTPREAAAIAANNPLIFVVVEYLDEKKPDDLEGVSDMKAAVARYYVPIRTDEFPKLEVIEYRRK